MPILVIQFPQINPIAIEIGPFAVRWYALAYIVGILGGWFYARAIVNSQRLWNGTTHPTTLDIDDFILWITLGIILGGRTGYVLFYNFAHFISNPIEILELWKGGMSFHGGFVGCVITVLMFARSRKLSILTLGDIVCATAPIGIFLVRVANFVNGELWGRPTEVPWAIQFPSGGPVLRHPSQLYEAGLEGVVMFFVLLALVRAGALKRPGLVVGWFALIYGSARSFCEIFREPDPQLGFIWGQLTMGILLSLPMIAAGLIFIACAYRRKHQL